MNLGLHIELDEITGESVPKDLKDGLDIHFFEGDDFVNWFLHCVEFTTFLVVRPDRLYKTRTLFSSKGFRL